MYLCTFDTSNVNFHLSKNITSVVYEILIVSIISNSPLQLYIYVHNITYHAMSLVTSYRTQLP